MGESREDEAKRLERERQALAKAETPKPTPKPPKKAIHNRVKPSTTPKKAPQIVEPTNLSSIQEKARAMVVAKWGEGHWASFDFIISKESGWNPNAVNKSSGACGLGQALPCSKMGGMDVDNQINWVIGYISDRYGTPNNAKAFWLAHRWY